MAPLRLRTLTIPTLLRTVGIGLLIVGIIGYALFQARFVIKGPDITLFAPTSVLQTEHTIKVRGTAKNITALTLNGKVIHTDAEGYFEETLVLPDSYTIMTLQAVDRYGRTETYTQTLLYSPSTTISLST